VRYREFPPSPDLQQIVECFWTLESSGGPGAPQRVVPDGHPELILNSGTPFEAWESGRWRRQPQLFFAGQIEGPLLLRPSGDARVLGVRFSPHGAAALIGGHMDELAARFTAVRELSPALSPALEDAAASANPVRGVESVLRRAARPSDTLVGESVRRLLLAPDTDIAALARDLGISLRQLERRFRAGVGLPPKLFGSMRRFLRVFRRMEEPGATWVETAIACGYYDQAHLIRDFRRFAGQTPAVLLARDADLARHFLKRHGVSDSYNTVARPRV
jgi:AraC-like DNA-binding protein